MSIKADNVDIKVINDAELLSLFKELSTEVQNRVITSGLRSAAQIITKEANQNFQRVKKNKSKTNYQFLKFSIDATRKGEVYGVKAGIKNNQAGNYGGYRLRWVEWGTKERFYTVKKRGLFNKKKGSKQETGKIEATHFFYDAVKSKREEAQTAISNAVMKSLERTVKKYSKN